MVNDIAKEPSLTKLESDWSNVFTSEFIVITIINVCTLITFARNRHLRKRTTYLIINLTVADLLVGAESGPMETLGQDFDPGNGFSWQKFITLTSRFIFPLASQVNLSLISLERLHATLLPFRHWLIEKWLYFKVIIGSWMITLLMASMMSVLQVFEIVLIQYALACYTFLTLLIITVSSVIITIKVKSNLPPQHFSAVASERKLSVTLSIVTVVSVLTILPISIWLAVSRNDITSETPSAANFPITQSLTLLYYTNSIVNPLIYAIRMQEFRKAVKEICKRTAATRAVQPIELNAAV